MREEKAEGSKRVIGPMPFLPARSPSQLTALPIPRGETRPTPVTATRREDEERGIFSLVLRGVLFDVLDGVLDLLDLFGRLVGNLDVERFFEGHHEFHGVKRIGAQVVHERGFWRDLVGVHAELLDDDALDLFFHTHALPLSSPKAAVFY